MKDSEVDKPNALQININFIKYQLLAKWSQYKTTDDSVRWRKICLAEKVVEVFLVRTPPAARRECLRTLPCTVGTACPLNHQVIGLQKRKRERCKRSQRGLRDILVNLNDLF